ncbi:lipoprotein, partial [Pantoea ananatis]
MNDDITTLLQQGASHLTQARRMTNVLPLLPVLIFIALSLTGCGQKTSDAPPIARPVRTMVVSLPSELPLQVMTG